MTTLKGSKTAQNLKDAFAGESQANRRYLYFAQKADVEGYNDVSTVFRSTAEGETGHAHGHLEFLEAVGDPATGEPIGPTDKNLKAAIAGETHEYTDMYPGMARTARDGRLRRDRRLVRDPGQGRKEPCRPLPEGARYAGLVRDRKSRCHGPPSAGHPVEASALRNGWVVNRPRYVCSVNFHLGGPHLRAMTIEVWCQSIAPMTSTSAFNFRVPNHVPRRQP